MFVRFGKLFFAPETETGTEAEEAEEEVEVEEGAEAEEAEEGVEAEEGEEEVAGAEGDEEPATPPKKENRYQRVIRERNEERDKRIRAEAKAETLEQTRAAPATTSPEEDPRVEAARLEAMEPWERTAYQQGKELKQLKTGMQLTVVQMHDTADRTAYQTKAATNPVYAKYADQVEAQLAKMRATGSNAPRQTVLEWLVGQAALNAKPSKKLPAKKAAAQERVASVKGKHTSGKGDESGQVKGEETLDDLKKRILAREARGDR